MLYSPFPPFDHTRFLSFYHSNREALDRLFDSRAKTVAWLASNCDTDSKREEYVRELQRSVDVDVYGDCGPLNCTTGRSCNGIIRVRNV